MNVQKTLAAALFGAGVFAAGLAQADIDVNLGTLGESPLIGSNGYAPNTVFTDVYHFTIGTLSTVGGAVGELNYDFGFGMIDLLSGWTVDLLKADNTSLIGGPYTVPGTVASASWTLDAGSYSVSVHGTTGAVGGAYQYSLNAVAVPVPEPGEFALMLSGLGLMGYMIRRRKNDVA